MSLTIRKSPFILMSIAIIAATAPLSAQDCGDCPRRAVMLYDMDVQVTRPSDPSQVLKWQRLFDAASSIADIAVNDPTASCLSFRDGSIVGQDGNVADTLVFGPGRAHTAPSGEIAGGDYLITGAVTGGEGSYTLTINLETACSREKVTTGTTTFAIADQAHAVGTTLGTQVFSRIATTIRQFEEDKRSGDPKVARDVQDDHMVLTPVKIKATRSETVPVEISLIDCDGTPLVGRTITLKESQFHGGILNGSENGTFTAQTVVTDGNGIARPGFRTGNTPGIAILRAYFIYKTPMGCEMVAGASATIVIEDPILDAYIVKATYSESSTLKRVWAGSVLFGYSSQKYESSVKKNISMTAICNNSGADEGILDLVSTSVSVQGSASDRTIHDNYDWGQAPGGPFGESMDYSFGSVDGIVVPGSDPDGKSGITCLYDPNNPESNYLSIFGTLIERTRNYEWHFTTNKPIVTVNTDTSETAPNALNHTVPWEGKGIFSVVDSGFTIKLDYDSSYEEPRLGEMPYLRSHSVHINVKVRPLSEFLTTAIRNRPERRTVRSAHIPTKGLQPMHMYDIRGRLLSPVSHQAAPGVRILMSREEPQNRMRIMMME